MCSAKKKPRLALVGLIIAILTAMAIYLCQEKEHSRITSPDGKYTAIMTYRLYEALLPMGPGQSSDKPGFIRIVDSSGANLGKIPLPMIQMAYDLAWTQSGAKISSIGVWNFSKREYRYWDKAQTRELIRRAR